MTVKIYTWKICPFCIKAKKLLDDLNINYEEIDIYKNDKKLKELSEITGFSTVPQIFIHDECIGGYDQLKRLHDEGKLTSLLDQTT